MAPISDSLWLKVDFSGSGSDGVLEQVLALSFTGQKVPCLGRRQFFPLWTEFVTTAELSAIVHCICKWEVRTGITNKGASGQWGVLDGFVVVKYGVPEYFLPYPDCWATRQCSQNLDE